MKNILYILLFWMISGNYLFAQSRIVGGYPVDISQRPYQATININGQFNGGGVIIGSEWILTAAHVVKNSNNITYLPNAVTICTGCTDLTMLYAPVVSISQIIVHPDYNPSTKDNDIALIKLSSPLTWSANRQPIAITDVDNYPTNTPAIVSGWGHRSIGGSSSLQQLYAGNITVVSISSSYFDYKKLRSGISPVAPYYGDSGGPVTINETSVGDLLVGLLSYGPADDPAKGYVYYTNVGYYQKWIVSNMGISNPIELLVPSLITRQATCSLTNAPTNTSVTWTVSNTAVATINNQGVVTAKGQGWTMVTALIMFPSGVKMTLHKNADIGIPLLYITVYNNEESYPLPDREFGANTNYVFVTNPIPGKISGNMQNYDFDFRWRLIDEYGSIIDSRTIENVWMRVGLFGTQFPNRGSNYRLEVDVVAADGTSVTYTRAIKTYYPYAISTDMNSTQITISPKKNNRLSLAYADNRVSIARLYNDGGMLRSVSFQSEEGTTIDVSSLPEGFYYLLILENGKVKQRQTMIIKH